MNGGPNLINPFRRKIDGSVGADPLGGRATEETGRYLALMPAEAVDQGIETLGDIAGLSVTRAAEFGDNAVDGDVLASAEAIVFDDLAVAVVNADPEQHRRLSALTQDSGILATEPERVLYAIDQEPPLAPPSLIGIETIAPERLSSRLSPQYLQGYEAAISDIARRAAAYQEPGSSTSSSRGMPSVSMSDSDVTWGLQATNVPASTFTGRGVRLAVLDTGIDLTHQDFAGREIVSKSFVANEDVQDLHGHGTYCAGTACGPREPAQPPRYGIASEAELYVGKVLSNAGRGTDATILAGIEWAIANNCTIISMSLGTWLCGSSAPSFSRIYEIVARRALAAGSLIIAAAGNDSRRPDKICPVRHPANCPSIMSVGALDPSLNVAWFSCGGLWRQGGQVDMAAPGVDVWSAWPAPTNYRSGEGTSIATPHLTGIAALYAEAYPDTRGGSLGWLLLQSATRLDAPGRDVGIGIPMAPTESLDVTSRAQAAASPATTRRRARKPAGSTKTTQS